MSEALLGTIISAVIAGVFNLISKRMELSDSRNNANSVVPSAVNSATGQPYIETINYGTVLKHIGILQFMLNLVGFILGFGLGMTGASVDTIIVAVLLVGTILLIVGFTWSALSVEGAVRWKHIAAVSVGVAITTLLINSIFLQQPISLLSIVVAFAQSFVSMGIGGVIANTVKR